MDDPLLTVREVAQRLRVTERTVRRWIYARRVNASKVTNRAGWRIRQSEVERLLREGEG